MFSVDVLMVFLLWSWQQVDVLTPYSVGTLTVRCSMLSLYSVAIETDRGEVHTAGPSV